MLDPLSALGLASNVIQLVDFASRLVKKGTEIHLRGETVDNARLEAVTVNLVHQSKNITTSVGRAGLPSAPRSQEEKVVNLSPPQNNHQSLMTTKILLDTARNCAITANELVECLENLKRKHGRNAVWRSFRQAIKTEWSKETIKAMAAKLDAYRSDLTLHTLFFLNTKVGEQIDSQEQRFNQLEKKSNEIIEAIFISNETSTHDSEELEISQKRIREQFQDAIAAIFTHRDGLITTISPPFSSNIPLSDVVNSNPAKKGVMTLQNRGSSNKSQDARVTFGNFASIQQRVLRLLLFRQIKDRIDEVAPAHKATFKWIFEDPKPSQRPWENFLEWLQKGSHCYWINGKAGSGKSTLMKYIYGSPQTRDALQRWAGGTRLIFASFFSWNIGSTLQKSQVGLLRSILHDILQQVPDLIPAVLPRLCRAASQGDDFQPTLAELKTGFEKLSAQTITPLKICLLIDGIDEFDGDHAEISEFIFFTTSKDFRAIVSSRPIPECVDVFGDCPSLRLQDLTYGDIKSYTNERVLSHRRWKELMEEEGVQAIQLLDDIVNKADGVFLWVILVIASLLEGLRNYDRVSDLRRRLEVLPSDLENLYSHMLNKLQPLYRRQGSQLLQIVQRHIEIEADQLLSPLQLSFADEEDRDYALRQELEPLSANQKLARCRAIEGRIRSRCCGLVEVWQDWSIPDSKTRIINARVSFLHRTVAEFLRKSHVSKEVIQSMVDKDFDPSVSLAKCFLADIKTSDNTKSMDFIKGNSWNSMQRCLNCCRFTTPSTTEQVMHIMDDLDKTMSRRWKSIDRWEESFTESDQTTVIVAQKFNWSLSELRQPYRLGNFDEFSDLQASMLVLAATMGLTDYIHYKCNNKEFVTDRSQLQQAMLAVVYSACRVIEIESDSLSQQYSNITSIEKRGTMENYSGVIQSLLDAGASPDQPVGRKGSTPWMLALQETEQMGFNSEVSAWADILRLFVLSGADPHGSAIEKKPQLILYRSALGVIVSKIQDCHSKNIPPHIRPYAGQFRDILAEIETLLKEKGAEVRDWTEIPDHIRPERDGTPAPWATKTSRLNEIFNPSAGRTSRRESPKRPRRTRTTRNISEYPPVSGSQYPVFEESRGRRGRSPRVDISPKSRQSSRSDELGQQSHSKPSLHDEDRPLQVEATTVILPNSGFSSGSDFEFQNPRPAPTKPDSGNLGKQHVHTAQRRQHRWLSWFGRRHKLSSVNL